MGMIGTLTEMLGNKREENGGRTYQLLQNVDTVTINDGDAVVYYDESQTTFDQPSTAKLSKLAGVVHNPNVGQDTDDTSYDIPAATADAVASKAWICVDGPCMANVEGTVDVAAGDILTPVNAQDYLVKDTNYVYDYEPTLTVTGAISTNTLVTLVAPFAMYLHRVDLSVGTAPAGAAMIIDVLDNAGTTFYTAGAGVPTIADGATKHVATAGPVVTTVIAKGDVIKFDCTQVGSGTAGSNLTIQPKFYRGAAPKTISQVDSDTYVVARAAQTSNAVVKTKVTLVRK